MTGLVGIAASAVIGFSVVVGGEVSLRIFPIQEITQPEYRAAFYGYPLAYAAPNFYTTILGRVSSRPFLSIPGVWSRVSSRATIIWPISLVPAIFVVWAVGSGTSVRVSREGKFLRGRKLHVGKEAIVELKRYLKSEIKKDGEGLRVLDAAPFSLELECRHGFAIGGVGSGKTVYIRRLIDAARYRGDKLLVHDVKGDFTSKLAGPFLLLAPHDRRSAIWNIARDIKTEIDAAELASRLIVEGRDPFWSQAAQALMIGWILYLMRTRGEVWGWSDLAKLAEASRDELSDVMKAHYPAALNFVDEANAMTSSVIASLKAPLMFVRMLAQAWPSDDLRPRFSFRDWLVSDVKNERTVIFQYAPNLPKLSSVWINSAVQLSASIAVSAMLPDNPRNADLKDQRRLWFVLDELPALKKLPAVESLIALGRSKGIRVFAAVQSWEQLVDVYGQNVADSWLAMSGTLLALYSKGKSGDRLSEVFGDAEFEVVRKAQTIDDSSKRRTHGYTPQLEKRRVLLPAAFEKLGKTKLENGQYGIGGYMLVGGDGFEVKYSFVDEKMYRPATMPAAWTTTLSQVEKPNV